MSTSAKNLTKLSTSSDFVRKAVFRFWAQNLADSALPHPTKAARFDISDEAITSGWLAQDLATGIRAKMHRASDRSEGSLDAPQLVLVCPTVLVPHERRGFVTGLAGSRSARGGMVLLPFLVPALLLADGLLAPPSGNQNKRPWFPRVALAPEIGELPTFGDLETFDEAWASLRSGQWDRGALDQGWRAYWEIVSDFCLRVSGSAPFALACQDWQRRGACLLPYEGHARISRQVIAVLDRLERESAQLQTVADVTCGVIDEVCGLGEQVRKRSWSGHFGHLSSAHGLVPSQRGALHRALATGSGDALPLSGPPGTGKTALLLDIVGSGYIGAAIEGREYPPLVAIASSNNKAISNALDAFACVDGGSDSRVYAKGGAAISRRWLPCFEGDAAGPTNGTRIGDRPLKLGYAQWLVSWSRRNDTCEYPKLYSDNGDWRGDITTYQTSDYVVRAVRHYLTCFGPPSDKMVGMDMGELLKDSVSSLHSCLCHARILLKEILEIRGTALAAHGSVPPKDWHGLIRKIETKRTIAIAEAGAKSRSIKDNIASFALSYDEHVSSLMIVYKDIEIGVPSWANEYVEAVTKGLWDARYQFIARSQILLRQQPTVIPFLHEFDAEIDGLRSEMALDIKQRSSWDHERLRTLLHKVEKYWSDIGPAPVIPDVVTFGIINKLDAYLDRTIRYGMWLMACRYWEGRWLGSLLGMSVSDFGIKPFGDGSPSRLAQVPSDSSVAKVRLELGAMSMLTPCMASTWANLYQVFVVWQKEAHCLSPLFGVFDLILADESGQAAPALGLAGLAFSRRAIIIGDLSQLPPISTSGKLGDRAAWGIAAASTGIPAGDRDELFKRLGTGGLLPCNGSLMAAAATAHRRIAAKSPGFGDAPRLRAHFRSVPEICELVTRIAYSEQEFRLQAIRPALTGRPWPGVCSVHVGGFTERAASGFSNRYEARQLVSWLDSNLAQIMEFYPGVAIEKVVAIIAPYRAQVEAIQDELSAAGIHGTDTPITVGSVYSLQGAESPVVLLSMTAVRFRDLQYVSGVSLLNVSISRARDHLFIFGDTTDWGQGPGALGILASYLDEDSARRLPWAFGSPCSFSGRPYAGTAKPKPGQLPQGEGAAHPGHNRLTILSESDTSLHGDENLDPRIFADQRCVMISTFRGHRMTLAESFEMARRRLVISSGYISSLALDADRICERIIRAKSRGVEVILIHDINATNGQQNGPAGVTALLATEALVLGYQRTHQKTIMVDMVRFVTSSWNFLSASRIEGGDFQCDEVGQDMTGGEYVRNCIREESLKLKLPPYPTGRA